MVQIRINSYLDSQAYEGKQSKNQQVKGGKSCKIAKTEGQFFDGEEDAFEEVDMGHYKDGNEGYNGRVDIIVDDDEDDLEEFDYIDINNLPNDQQQYFLDNYDHHEQLEDDEDYEEGEGNEQSGHEEEEEDQNPNVQFNEHLIDEEGGQDEQSDYCEDLVELYQNSQDDVDLLKYQGIHLMNRQCNEEEEDREGEEERYSCPETGAHFEFLEMCGRLKRLQKKRAIVDKALEEEEGRRRQREEE